MAFYHDNPDIDEQSFQEILRHRREERKAMANEMYRHGRHRIDEMKSTTGKEPLDLLVEEMWIEIMSKLSPKDLENMYQIHDFFKSLLERKHVGQILLPMCIPILLDYMKRQGIEPDFPSFCELWNTTKDVGIMVDQWFQDEMNPVPGMTLHLFHGRNDLNKLVERAKTLAKARKSFFLRSLEVVISTLGGPYDFPLGYNLRSDTFLPFKNTVIELLKLFGRNIFVFKLTINRTDFFVLNGVTFADHYHFLQECCSLMPNLIRLEIYFEHKGYYGITDEGNLSNVIEEYTFPRLNNLNRLSFSQDPDIWVTPRIYNAILKANPHVKILKCQIENVVLENKIPKDTFATLELEQFELENNMAFSLSPGCAGIIISDHYTWPLKTLKLYIKSQSLKYIFNSLMRFQTLEKVTLDLSELKIRKNYGFLHLPQLTHFDCSFNTTINYDKDDVNFFMSLHFLLHNKKLKWLRWWSKARSENNKAAAILRQYLENHTRPDIMVDFRNGRREDMDSSNVWNVFPGLKAVHVVLNDAGDEPNVREFRRPTLIGLLQH